MKLNRALDLMRSGSVLVCETGLDRHHFLIPGGEVDDVLAARLKEHPQIVGSRDGMWPELRSNLANSMIRRFVLHCPDLHSNRNNFRDGHGACNVLLFSRGCSMKEERDAYVSLALKILQHPNTTAQTVKDLEKWWRDEKPNRINLGIVRGYVGI